MFALKEENNIDLSMQQEQKEILKKIINTDQKFKDKKRQMKLSDKLN